MKILHIVGARPNFMKVAPVMQTLRHQDGVDQKLVHTGQHYDVNMSDVFFQELDLPFPDINLNVGSASHAVQTAKILIGLESVLLEEKADLVLVYGDVNSTVAAALTCSKLGVPLGHVEAGLRSFDRTMPEEINRVLTDCLSDLLFTPSMDGNENLQKEGIARGKIHLVGNVMIDTLKRLLPRAHYDRSHLPERYILVTLHRPSTVDDGILFQKILETLIQISIETPIVFPVHPRTRLQIADDSVYHSKKHQLFLLEPLPYLHFLDLERHAAVVITDSGGIQEETTYLGISCLTMRKNTERPITITDGTNQLIGYDMELLKKEVNHILGGHRKAGKIPYLWDGLAAQRIADILIK